MKFLTDSTSLTPSKIQADNQIAAVLHRGRAFSFKRFSCFSSWKQYRSNGCYRSKDGCICKQPETEGSIFLLTGAFGSINANDSNSALFDLTIDSESGDSPTALSPRHVAKAQSLLGDQGGKLTTIAMHSKCYYDLVERRAVDFVLYDNTGGGCRATGGSTIQNAFGNPTVPTFMGLRVIVSDDIPTTGVWIIY